MSPEYGQSEQQLSDLEDGFDLSKTAPLNVAKLSLSVHERSASVKAALESNSLTLGESMIICLEDGRATEVNLTFSQALAAPVWQGGCLAMVGGPAMQVMWGKPELLCIITFEGCSKEDINEVVAAVKGLIKGGAENSLEYSEKSEEDELPWGAFVSSNTVQTIKTTPVLHLGVHTRLNSFSMTSLPGGSTCGGTELFSVRMR